MSRKPRLSRHLGEAFGMKEAKINGKMENIDNGERKV
jgi:hypothetical protein